MAAPSIAVTVVRPTRADGSPFTPSVYNADRARVLNVILDGVLGAEGGVINGDQTITGKATSAGATGIGNLVCPGLLPTAKTTGNLTVAGNASVAELLAKGSKSTKLLVAGTASYSLNLFAGGTIARVAIVTIPLAVPWPTTGVTTSTINAVALKYGVLIVPVTRDHPYAFTGASLWATYPFPAGTPPQTQIYAHTEPIPSGGTATGSFLYIIFQHTA